MLPTKDRYDWIILGDQLPSVLLAAWLGKLGFSVLLNPLDPVFLSRELDEEAYLDPEMNLVLGASSSSQEIQLLSQCIDRAGGLLDHSKIFIESVAGSQLLIPGSRIEQSPSIEKLVGQIEREWGKIEEGDLARLKQLEGAGRSHFVQEWNSVLAKFDQPVPEKARKNWELPRFDWKAPNAEMLNFLERLFLNLNGIFSSKFSHDAIPSVFAALGSACRVRGGLTKLRDALVRTGKKNGVEFLTEPLACRILVEKKRLIGINLLGFERRIYCSNGSIGCSPEFVQENFKEVSLHPKRVELIGWWLTLVLRVQPQGVPVGASDQMLWSEGGAPPLFFEVADPLEYGINDKSNRLLFLRTAVPYHSRLMGVEHVQDLAAKMLAQSVVLFPFLSNHLVSVSPRGIWREFENATTGKNRKSSESVDNLQSLYPFLKEGRIPANLKIYSGSGMGVESSISGLFYAGHASFPQLGPLGWVAAAAEVSARATQKLRSIPPIE